MAVLGRRILLLVVMMVPCMLASYTPLTQDLRLDTIYLDWSIAPDSVEVTVCFLHGTETTSYNQSRYELLITNADGGSWQQRQVSMKTDKQKCFDGVTLGKDDVAKTLVVSVKNMDSSGQKVISRAEVEQFIIGPEVKQLTSENFLVSWWNPGGHTFTIRRQGEANPLTTSLTCVSCTYYLTSQDKQDTPGIVVIETEAVAPVKLISQVKMTRTGFPEPLELLEVLELHEVLREEDPSGRNHYIKVVLAEHKTVNVSSWSLTFISSLTDNPNTTVYTNPENYESLPDQIEILFEGHVISADMLILTAGGADGNELAVCIKQVTLKDLGTRVAWVGDQPSYLRVHTGTLESVKVTEEYVCHREDSPCYFPQSDNQLLPLEVSRCINVTASDNSLILQCDEVISQYQNMTKDPALLLQDLTILEVTQISSASLLEVLITSVDDGSILQVIPCTEAEEGRGTCSVTINLADRKEVYNTMVLLDDAGYVIESKIVLFEVYKIKVKQLREDAVVVVWEDSSSDTYIVSVNTTGLEVMVDCLLPDGEAGAEMCQAHIISPDLTGDPFVLVSVRKASENNTVAVTDVFTEDLPEESVVSRMTQVMEEGAPATTVRVTAAVENIVTAGLVKHSGSPINTIITEKYYIGGVNYMDGEYMYIFEISEDILKPGESSNFLAIGYKDDGSIGIVGAAYVTPIAIDVSLAQVGSTKGPLRVATSTESNLIVADNPDWTCTSENSPCYLPETSVLPDQVPVCLTLDNGASGEDNKQVLQCQQCQVTPFQGISDARLILSEHINLQVDASYLADTVTLEVEVVTDSSILSEHCDPLSLCQIDYNSFPSVFQVLLVGLGVNDVVVESTLIPFQDLNVTSNQLTKDILEVRWSSLNPETYTVTIQPVIPSSKGHQVSPLLTNGESIAPTRVTCSAKTLSCKAHFVSLPEGSYTVLVQRGEDATMVAKNTQVDSSFLPPLVSKIIRVTRIDEGTTRVSLEAPLDGHPSVWLSVVIEGDETKEVSSEGGQMVTELPATYQFSHQEPVFITEVTTKFILVARQNENLVSVGRAYLSLLDLHNHVTWVGDQAEETSASLRVDSFTVPDLPTDSMVCLDDSTVCYYLEVGGKVQSIERCEEVENMAPEESNKVEQCDKEITDFTEFSSVPVVEVVGNSLEVTLKDSSSSNSLEVLAYDPDNTSTLYSTPQHCNVDEATQMCAQSIKIPRGRTQVKVLVVAVKEDKTVNESTVIFMDISSPSHGTEDWVIAVSVLGSVFGVAFITYAIIVIVMKIRKPVYGGNINRSYVEAPAEGVIRAPMPSREEWAQTPWEESPPPRLHQEPWDRRGQPSGGRYQQELTTAPQVRYDAWDSRPLGQLPHVTLKDTPIVPSSSIYQSRTHL